MIWDIIYYIISTLVDIFSYFFCLKRAGRCKKFISRDLVPVDWQDWILHNWKLRYQMSKSKQKSQLCESLPFQNLSLSWWKDFDLKVNNLLGQIGILKFRLRIFKQNDISQTVSSCKPKFWRHYSLSVINCLYLKIKICLLHLFHNTMKK